MENPFYQNNFPSICVCICEEEEEEVEIIQVGLLKFEYYQLFFGREEIRV